MKNQDTALEGNKVNNIPRTVANVSVDYTLESGFSTRMNVRAVGKYAIGLENFFYYKGYTRVGACSFIISQSLLS